jgi:hypothetical protein
VKIVDLVLDNRTMRLTKVVKAFTLAEDLERPAARSLVDTTTAIRALAEAGETRACGDLAERLGKATMELVVENPALDWPALIGRHCQAVVNATGPKREVR